MTAVATSSPARARYYGYGPGIFGGLVAGALIAGIASRNYGYGPGYVCCGYSAGSYGGDVYRKPYYGYRHVYALKYVHAHYYGGHRSYGGWLRASRMLGKCSDFLSTFFLAENVCPNCSVRRPRPSPKCYCWISLRSRSGAKPHTGYRRVSCSYP